MAQLDPTVLTDDGKLGYATPGDIIDASGYDTFLRARGTSNLVHLQQQSTDMATFSVDGMTLPSNSAYIAVGSFLGIKTKGGAKLGEFKNNGNFIIGGNTYNTNQSTYNYAANGSFDGFDFAECYPCDAHYPDGTVVCPGTNEKFTKCTHDNCPCAVVLTHTAGYCIGETDEENHIYPVAMVGRVRVKTAFVIGPSTLICSDGRGGVRSLAPGEWGFVLGFTLHETNDQNMVGVYMRPMFCQGI